MISVTSLAEFDEFRLVPEDYMLVGARSGRKFRMGDKVRIKVISANLAKRQLDYEWVLATSSEDPMEAEHKQKKILHEAAHRPKHQKTKKKK